MGSPKNGWFMLGERPSFEMDDDWGYPHDSGNPHIRTPIEPPNSHLTPFISPFMENSVVSAKVMAEDAKVEEPNGPASSA